MFGKKEKKAPMSERQQMALLKQITAVPEQGPSGHYSKSKDRNERGETALHIAAKKGDADTTKKLLDQGINPNSIDFAGWTALHEAANHGHYNVAVLLVKAGADVNAMGFDDITPLHDAAMFGQLKMVKMLIEKGADPFIKNKKGKTPQDVAHHTLQNYFANLVAEISNKEQHGTKSEDSSSTATSNVNKDEDDIYEFKMSKDCGSDGDKVVGDTSETDDNTTKTKVGSENDNTVSGGGSETKAGSSDGQNKGVDKKGDNQVDSKLTDTKKESNTISTTDGSGKSGDNNFGAANEKSENDEIIRSSNANNQKSDFKEGSGNNESGLSGTSNDSKMTGISDNNAMDGNDKTNKNENDGISSNSSNSNQTSLAANSSVAPANSSNTSSLSSTTNTTDNKSTNLTGSQKRPLNDAESADDTSGSQNDDEVKRKRRKENDDASKDNEDKNNSKQGSSKTLDSSSKTGQEKKSPCASPKPPKTETDGDTDGDVKMTDENAPKVPPLKIVIPQQNNGNTYVVASSNSTTDEKAMSPEVVKNADEKTEKTAEDKVQQRILRSSHKTDRSSNNSSPQMQPNSPSPVPTSNDGFQAANQSNSSSSSGANAQPSSSSSSTEPVESINVPSPGNQFNSIDIHPRKRKIRTNNKETPAPVATTCTSAPVNEEKQDNNELNANDNEHITNNYQMFLNIRRQIDKRHKNLMPVQPKPPQGFKDYLLKRRSYVLAGKTNSEPIITYPATLPDEMKETFTKQENERYKLKMQHVVEKEKLVLSVEQEILRVHGKAARTLANQLIPFSVCTILKDQEVYNVITPEQEEKERQRNAPRGRLFLSWLQDVDDKWEKIKESMIMRHHDEAESLHAVQKMFWEWKMKELSLCDYKSKPVIAAEHVPIVSVNDDFDLLPA